MKNLTVFLLTTLLLLAVGTTAWAQRTASVSGNWSNTATWGGSAVPISTDAVTINSGITVTVDVASAQCASITFAAVNANSVLTISGTNSLSLNGGALTMPQPAAGFTCTVNVGAGSVLGGSLSMAATTISAGTRTDIVTISTGTLTVTGNVTLSGTTGDIFTFTGAGTLSMGGTVSAGPPTLTPNTGTVNYNGAAQTVWATTYNNLVLSGSGAKTTTGVTVNGILTMSGTATASAAPTYGGSSSLVYAGSAAQTTGAELLATMAQPVTLSNSNGVSLGNSTVMNGTLTFSTAGCLLLGANNLTIGGGTTGGSYDRAIVTGGTGAVTSPSLAQSQLQYFPIAKKVGEYDPVYITNKSITAQTFTISVQLGELPVATADPSQGCGRTWTISGSVGDNYDILIEWSPLGQGTGVNVVPLSCTLWYYSASWIQVSGSGTAGSDPYTTSANGLNHFSTWTIGNIGALPVQMTSFGVTANRLNAELKWSTATAVNCYGFEIERRLATKDVSAWTKVGFVQGAGTSNSPKNYSYKDAGLAPASYIYRIKQVDADGKFEYYTPAEVEIGLAAKALTLAQNYPNPFNPSTKIEFTVPEGSFVTLKVYNTIGQEVATLFSGFADAGKIQQVTFDASRLPSGLYFSRLDYAGQHIVQKMTLMK
jgi:hypothetical protein